MQQVQARAVSDYRPRLVHTFWGPCDGPGQHAVVMRPMSRAQNGQGAKRMIDNWDWFGIPLLGLWIYVEIRFMKWIRRQDEIRRRYSPFKESFRDHDGGSDDG